jgi:hypothetical protein
MKIRDVLARRSDLSTFLVHLTRSHAGLSARERLESIITTMKLAPGSMFGHAKRFLEEKGLTLDSQRCVCFTETPLEEVHLLCEQIDGRSFQFERYGIAITKLQGREKGVNPVWYVDMTPGHDFLTNNLNRLMSRGFSGSAFTDPDIEAVLPFCEHMGSGAKFAGGTYRKEFWWEREWRRAGKSPLVLPLPFLALCPEDEIPYFTKVAESAKLGELVRLVDPAWSLEQIIARLAAFPAHTVDFP